MADDYALAQRLDFMRLDNETQDTIRSLRPLIQKAIGPALDDFYARVRQTPEVSRFFSNPNHMDSAKSRQASHWGIIAEANYGDSYARGVRAIGETHARLGLEPRWYIGGYALVAEKLMEAVVAEAFPKAGLQMVKPGQGAKAARPGKDAPPLVAVDKKGAPLEDQQVALKGIKGLILLDGTWSQAKTLWWRNAWLLKCRRLVLAPARPSAYGKLRREPRRDSLSTLEAAALAVSVLERDDGLYDRVTASLRLLVQKAGGKPA